MITSLVFWATLNFMNGPLVKLGQANHTNGLEVGKDLSASTEMDGVKIPLYSFRGGGQTLSARKIFRGASLLPTMRRGVMGITPLPILAIAWGGGHSSFLYVARGGWTFNTRATSNLVLGMFRL